MVELGISKGESERNFKIHEKREQVDFMGNPSCGERVDTTTIDISHRSEQKKRTVSFKSSFFLFF